jgi:hypothetical protein
LRFPIPTRFAIHEAPSPITENGAPDSIAPQKLMHRTK